MSVGADSPDDRRTAGDPTDRRSRAEPSATDDPAAPTATDGPTGSVRGTANRSGRDRAAERRVPVRAAWGIAYRTATMLGAALLAAFAFTRHTLLWDLAGAVLVAFAIVDLILLVAVTWFRWRHRDD